MICLARSSHRRGGLSSLDPKGNADYDMGGSAESNFVFLQRDIVVVVRDHNFVTSYIQWS